jgi:2-aminoadipate transaminase
MENFLMKFTCADRMKNIPRSFVRDILKVTEDPDIISFAGGLPNPSSFPVDEIAAATSKVLKEDGNKVLQYSTTEGYAPLREYIARNYSRKGLKVQADEILITNGSQQCLDLIGKIFINKNDMVLLEQPSYLAAIQAFSLFEPNFKSVQLLEDGVDTESLNKTLLKDNIKLFYAVTNFQNPTGLTYSKNKRKEMAEILENHNTIFVEDDPYGDIRFIGNDLAPATSYISESVLFGSFSKIISPGMRLGWIVAQEEMMDKLIIAKQASDLHSNYFAQRVVYQYLQDNNVDRHIQKIRKIYKTQRDLMVDTIKSQFPPEVKYTQPEGGMFLWVTLPNNISSLELLELALDEKVIFVPGEAFYVNTPQLNTLRLNFSNSNHEKITEGIKRLGIAIEKLNESLK